MVISINDYYYDYYYYDYYNQYDYYLLLLFILINDYYLFNTLNNKTPWFSDKMTIVRQKTPRVWSNIMDEVATLVKEKLSK
jgi:hypothetical protein